MSFDESDEYIARHLLKTIQECPDVGQLQFNASQDSPNCWPVTVNVFAKSASNEFPEAVKDFAKGGHHRFAAIFDDAFQSGPQGGFALRFPFLSAKTQKQFFDALRDDGLA